MAPPLEYLHAYMEGRLDQKAFKMLNLAAEWLRTYLPHTLQKIDRVSFGLLSVEETKKMQARSERPPYPAVSRRRPPSPTILALCRPPSPTPL